MNRFSVLAEKVSELSEGKSKSNEFIFNLRTAFLANNIASFSLRTRAREFNNPKDSFRRRILEIARRWWMFYIKFNDFISLAAMRVYEKILQRILVECSATENTLKAFRIKAGHAQQLSIVLH